MGPFVIRKLTALQDRAVGAQRRPADPSGQGRHADHGRRADPALDRDHDVAVGDLQNRFVWVVLLVTLGFGVIGWVDDYRKVVQRNPKGLSARTKYFWQSVIGIAAAVYLAFAINAPTNAKVWDLFSAWVQSGFTIDLPNKTDLIVPFFKNVAYPLGVFGFIVLTYFVIVGTIERGESHRRPRRPGDHAGGDGGRRAWRVRVCRGQRGLLEVPAVAVHPGRGRADRRSAPRWSARGSVFCGSTPIRRKSSWAMSARWRSARRSARSR